MQELLHGQTDDLRLAPIVVPDVSLTLEGVQVFHWLDHAELDPWLGLRAIQGFVVVGIFWTEQRVEATLDLHWCQKWFQISFTVQCGRFNINLSRRLGGFEQDAICW